MESYMMTNEEFKEEVQEFIRLYLMDYVYGEPKVEYIFDDPDDPTAEITFVLRQDMQPFYLTIGVDGDEHAGIHVYEDNYAELCGEGMWMMIASQFEDRLRDTQRLLKSAQG